MASASNRSKADSVITMRVSRGTRELIDSAASAQGKTRTEFVIESARTNAIDVLFDQRLFTLDAEQSDAIAEMLANPPPPNDALRALMAAKAPWE